MDTGGGLRRRELETDDGRRLRVYEAGAATGPLVLVHHGTPGAGVLWQRWIEQAAGAGIRLASYDRPGYGGSDRRPGRSVADAAADAAAVADVLGAPRFATWGISGGGPHALACAALLPERVTAAASLAGVAPRTADGLDWSAGMGGENQDEFGAAERGEQPLRGYLAPTREGVLAATPATLQAEFATLLSPVDVAALGRGVASFLHESFQSGLEPGYEGWLDDDLAFVSPWGFEPADVRVPVLLLQGRQDLMVPFEHGRWLAGRLPTVEARLAEDHGHLTLLEDLSPVHEWLLAAGGLR